MEYRNKLTIQLIIYAINFSNTSLFYLKTAKKVDT